MTTSDTSLPRTQALVRTLAARGGASLEFGASRVSTSAVTPTSAGASAGARARDRVVATRVRDPSGSRTPPSQQSRSIPSTTALDQSSLEFCGKSLFDQSELEDVKRLFLGWSGFSVISTSKPVPPFSVVASFKTRSLVP